ncbi:MAG TPA: hypothetical protein VGN11_06520 [Candidatus Baltobacteraceae bacterium]|jgi:hypothetical protein|nr:hypothetical protein [Candidatus Baltobacteraceae bacterium]
MMQCFRTALAVAACAVLFTAFAKSADATDDAGTVGDAGTAQFDRLVGTWDGPGTFVDSAYSQAGTANAVTTCAWSENHVFVICQQRVVMNGKPSSDVSVYAYDEAAKKYHFYNIGVASANGTQLRVDARSMTYTDTFTDGAKHVTTRTLNVWENPGRYTWRSEYSLDGGATWTLMGSGTATKR